MISLTYVYWLVGAFLLFCAVRNLRERRWTTAIFWTLIAIAFLFGDAIKHATAAGFALPAQAMGLGVVALGVLAALQTRFHPAATDDKAPSPHDEALRLGNRLFIPALTIPLVTIVLALLAPHAKWNGVALLDPANATVVALGLACVVALFVALRTTGARAPEALAQGRRLLDTIGSVAMLPMLLATLGVVFVASGVGQAVSGLIGAVIPTGNALACLAAFAFGMLLFTVIMGNAFAAFPVMMAGIGLPLLITQHGAHAAPLGALGMLTGYCGSLLTPMAANFNIVPAALLELRDQYGVIRAQVPTAFALLAVNFVLMVLFVFR